MTKLASVLEDKGWVLRSGGASGADSAFEAGIKDRANMEVFLPSTFFNGKRALDKGYADSTKLASFPEALETVNKYHPAPHKLSGFPKILMARNAMQVLGPDLNSPSQLVIAWTNGGKMVGGTSQAIRIATDLKIPVLNLGCPGKSAELEKWLDSPSDSPLDMLY